MKTYCNPLDLPYRYQHMNEQGRRYAFREGADPTLVYFKGTYYLFVSMSAGFFYSDDLLGWRFHADPDLMIYDYAPDVRQVGDYLYFCASSRSKDCPILRSADPLHEKFEQVAAPFPFWDPDLFLDDDGRLYFYWGCTNTEPIWGVELDRETLQPIGEKRPLIAGDPEHLGYERPGENGVVDKESSVVYRSLTPLFNSETGKIEMPAAMLAQSGMTNEALTKIFLAVGQPYVEGAFMTKHDGRYYLQYAAPGTQYNTYADGVYVGQSPLGPFTRQASNPFSAVTGGFITGAGHGSTVADRHGNFWHAATMRISVNHDFERRVGLFPASFDGDGVLYCNQNFADYPHRIPEGRFDPASWQPEWMLLSYAKPAFASSTAAGSSPALAVDENIRSWWSAADAAPGQWLAVDLGKPCDVRAVQVNLADQDVVVEFPPEAYGDDRRTRHIELEPQISRYTLEVSIGGEVWHTLETVARECSNGYYEYETGVTARYVRVVGGALPYGQPLRIAGLRVFGNGGGAKPAPAKAAAERVGDLDAVVRWQPLSEMGAQGVNIRYGTAPDKLYLSHLVYGANEATLTTLVAGQGYYVAVDSFNENGVTPGAVFVLKEGGFPMIPTGVQQFMLGTALNNETQARQTLAALKAAGYTGIELCGFMIHPTGLMVRLLTRAAGMPTGNGGKLDWHKLVQESGLSVVSLHTDLGSVERDAAAVAAEAKSFGTSYAVITGMYRFAYADAAAWHDLAKRLNKAGAALAEQGVRLLYHNHNCELQRVEGEKRGYDILLAETEPNAVNFEFDSYWFAEGGADVAAVMKTLGNRMKLWHINDRGTRLEAGATAMTPILKTDSMELGTGNLPLEHWAEIAKENGVEAVVLESHRNWVDKDPVKSAQVSARWLHEHL